MTLPSTTRRAGPFNGNGVTTVFPFTFKVFADSDIVVEKTVTATGVTTTLVLTTDYTVTLNADQNTSPGGSVTYVSLATGERLAITGGLPYSQTLDLPGGGPFNPESLENALDRITMLVQQVQEMTGRTVVLPATSADASTELPSPNPSYLLGWDAGGTYLQNYPYSSLGISIAYGNWQTQTFNGTGAQTAFVLTYDAGNASNCDVTVNGVTQIAGVNFNYTPSTKTITFTTGAPPSGTNNVAIRYGSAVPIGTGAISVGGVTNTAATYTVLSTDHTVIQTSGASTYSLPSAAANPGRLLCFQTKSANAITSAASDVILLSSGGPPSNSILPATSGKYVVLQAIGTAWYAIAGN